MRIFANLHRDGMSAVAERVMYLIRNDLLANGTWVVAIYGNGNVRVFRFCAEFPPVGTMYCLGPYNRQAQPEFIEEDILREMQELTRSLVA